MRWLVFFFFKQKTAYEMLRSLVGSEMCIRDRYELLFEEKLELFAALLESNRTGEPVSWSGKTRGPLNQVRVYPRTESGRLTTWIGVGGSPESVVRAARYRLPLMLAIIGGDPRRFKPFADLYHRALQQFDAPSLPIGVHSPGHVAELSLIHISEPTRLLSISYAVFCLKKKTKTI